MPCPEPNDYVRVTSIAGASVLDTSNREAGCSHRAERRRSQGTTHEPSCGLGLFQPIQGEILQRLARVLAVQQILAKGRPMPPGPARHHSHSPRPAAPDSLQPRCIPQAGMRPPHPFK
jgi:hypothetical protein